VVQTIATMNLPSTTQPAVGQLDRLSSFLTTNSSHHSRDAHQAHATCTLPSSSISGDGYIALFSAQVGKVYLSYHHTAATIVCINVYTGSICAHADARANIAALSSFAYVGTPTQYGGQTMFSNRWMYTTVVAYPASDGSLGCTWGILCFDTQLNQFCTSTATAGPADAGWLALGSTTLHCPQPGISGGLQPIPGQINSFVTVGPDGTLYCFQANPTTGMLSSCGPINSPQNVIPLTLVASDAPILITIGNQLYSYINGVPSTPQRLALLCWDFSNAANNYKCGGPLANGPVYPTHAPNGNFFNMYYPMLSGIPVAVCTIDVTSSNLYACVSINSTSGTAVGYEITDTPTLSWMVPTTFTSGTLSGVNLLATPFYIGTKMYYGRWMYPSIDCFDWSTQASCGTVTFPVGTPNFFYQVTQDSYGCLWALADSGETYVLHSLVLKTPTILRFVRCSCECNRETTRDN